jgi:2-keto-4-pentenoate hydratase/2-oxohepta-3-ene-1,7-dioic acid hydratase in catechol pathway
MRARVNGLELSVGNAKDIYFTFAQLIERASSNVMLYEGDVIGSGTVGTGCLLELGGEESLLGRWLQVGDEVELEIEGIGILQNTIGEAV